MVKCSKCGQVIRPGTDHSDEFHEDIDDSPAISRPKRRSKPKKHHGGIKRNHMTGELAVPSSVPSMFPDIHW